MTVNKYRNVRVGGYPSKAQAHRAAQLRLLEKAGAISDLQEEVSYDVQPERCERITYRADFMYLTPTGTTTVFEDVKSKATMTRESIIKLKLLKWTFPRSIVRCVDKHGNVLREFTLAKGD